MSVIIVSQWIWDLGKIGTIVGGINAEAFRGRTSGNEFKGLGHSNQPGKQADF